MEKYRPWVLSALCLGLFVLWVFNFNSAPVGISNQPSPSPSLNTPKETASPTDLSPTPRAIPEVPPDILLRTDKETSVSVGVLSRVADAVALVGANPGTHGRVHTNPKDNTLTYTPDAGYVGEDSFTYSILDSKGKIVQARMNVQVIGYRMDLREASVERGLPRFTLIAYIDCYPTTLGERLRVSRVFTVGNNDSTASLPPDTFVVMETHDHRRPWGLIWTGRLSAYPDGIKNFGVELEQTSSSLPSASRRMRMKQHTNRPYFSSQELGMQQGGFFSMQVDPAIPSRPPATNPN